MIEAWEMNRSKRIEAMDETVFLVSIGVFHYTTNEKKQWRSLRTKRSNGDRYERKEAMEIATNDWGNDGSCFAAFNRAVDSKMIRKCACTILFPCSSIDIIASVFPSRCCLNNTQTEQCLSHVSRPLSHTQAVNAVVSIVAADLECSTNDCRAPETLNRAHAYFSSTVTFSKFCFSRQLLLATDSILINLFTIYRFRHYTILQYTKWPPSTLSSSSGTSGRRFATCKFEPTYWRRCLDGN